MHKKLSIQSRNGLMETVALVDEILLFQISQDQKKELYYLDKHLKIVNKITIPVGISMEFSYLIDQYIFSRDFYTAKPLFYDLKNKSFKLFSSFNFDFDTSSGGYKSFYPISESVDIFSPFKSGLYDFLVDELKWITDISSNLYFFEKFLIGFIGRTILRYHLDTGQILWRFDVSEIDKELEVSRLVGIWNGILVAGIGEDYMIGINTENGELVWKRKAIPDFDIIDQSLGVLHSLTSGYVKTDIRTGKTLDIFDKKEYFEEEIGIESQRNNYVLVGDHIITSDWKKGKLGAFNTITHRFDWIHEEPGVSFPAGQAMKYFDPYLFVMDSKEVLHIFRKE